MNELKENLLTMMRELKDSAIKRRQISYFFKKKKFISLKKGAWLGFRNNDIVSGFIVEGSPMNTYISTFILPAYDKHVHITWGLGDRIVHCSLDVNTNEQCEKAIDYYLTHIFEVRSSSSLLHYLDSYDIQGHYPIWVRYISYLKDGSFICAENYLDKKKRDQLHFTQIEKFEEIKGFVTARDEAGVSQILQGWSVCSERIFGPFSETFRIF